MKLPVRAQAARDGIILKFGLPVKRVGESQDDFEGRCRAICTKIAEQALFNDPSGGWGVKSAGPGRPQSKDTIAQNLDGLRCWDLFSGTGTGTPTLVEDPQSQDINGQSFITVQPFDYLGGVVIPAPDPKPVPTSNLENRVAALEAALAKCLKVGDQVTISSASTGRLLTTEDGFSPASVGEMVGDRDNRRPKGCIIANRESPGPWEQFKIDRS